MQILKAINTTRNKVLAERVRLANNFFTRLRGLLLTTNLPPSEGLLLVPCKSIHSIGMAYSIDAIFLDENNLIVGVVNNFEPLRVSSTYWKAQGCLELPSGIIIETDTAIGDKLSFENLTHS